MGRKIKKRTDRCFHDARSAFKGRVIMHSLLSVQGKGCLGMGMSVRLSRCQHISLEHHWKITNKFDMKVVTLETTPNYNFVISCSR
jgi:hypothetical protein